MKLCAVSDQPELGVPAAIEAELHGPEVIAAGERAIFELRYVNRSTNPIPFVVAIKCASHLRAVDHQGKGTIRSESTTGSDVVSKCDGPGVIVSVVLEPDSGMVVETLEWKAMSELYVDMKLKRRAPLAPGKYKLTAGSWLTPESAAATKTSQSHGIYKQITASRVVTVK